MTIAINGSGTITGISVGGLNDNIITKNEMATGGAWAPAGTVLQVVSATSSTQSTTTSTSFAASSLSASITPTSATSKIFVAVTSNGRNATTNTDPALYTVYRNSTNIGGTEGFSVVYGSGTPVWAPLGITCLDSPATTSSVTYALYFRLTSASGTAYCGWGVNTPQTITLMEIAA